MAKPDTIRPDIVWIASDSGVIVRFDHCWQNCSADFGFSNGYA